MKRTLTWRLSISALAALLLAAGAAATNGYFTHGYGTANKGLAGAGVALPHGALAAATNPAALVFVGKRYDAGVAMFNPNRQYTINGNPSGFPGTFGLIPGTVDSDSTLFAIPHFAANWQKNDDTAFGFMIYGHGGMNTDYPAATFFASSPTGVDFSQLFLAGTWAKRFGGRHAFGITPIFAIQFFEMQGVGSFAPFSADPARLSDNGSDQATGFGLKVGYLGQLSERFSFGVSYQSEMSMEEFDDYAGLFAEQGGFDVPATWTAGIALGLTEGVTLVFDVQETMYSDVTSVGAPFLPNLMTARLGDDGGAGFGWQDMTTYKLGLQWESGGDWVWRVGASTTDQPIPSTEVLFNILAPGVMEEHYTVGFTRKVGDHRAFNLALMHAPSVDVEGPNPLEVPGLQGIVLEMDQWELEISYSWGF